jgi:hypothetical protein
VPRTPDRSPGALEEDEEIRFVTEPGASPSQNGALTYDPSSGSFLFRDVEGVFNPRNGGGLDEEQHRLLDTLTHSLSESHEQVPVFDADGVMTSVAARVTGGGTLIRVADNVSANSDGLITSARVRQFDANEDVVETLTASITVTGGVPAVNTVTRT